MDILTVLLLFLLKSYVAEGEVVVPPPGVTLPASSAEASPKASLVVSISGDAILVGEEHVASITDAVTSETLLIEPLDERLKAVREQRDEIARLQGKEQADEQIATIQGDRKIEFRVLERVMYTLNRNGYGDIALAVIRST
jgi:biopolymer transport protein ExbD